MNLSKDNIKKILLIITFTIVIYTISQNLNMIFVYLGVLLGVMLPFFIGGAIAFVLNIPMHALEKHFFCSKKIFKKQLKTSVIRPISLVISIIFVLAICATVVNIVLPQLITTIYSIGNSIYAFIPKLTDFSKTIIGRYFQRDLNIYINKLMNFKWNEVMGYIIDFIKGGGSFLDSTIGVVSTIFSTTVNIIIGIIFAIYILLQKEKLSVQARKIIFAICNEKIAKSITNIASLSYKTFSNFVTGQCLEACILGILFFIVLNICRMPYSVLIGVLIAFTALIPLVGAFIGCVISAFLIFMVSPIQALIFIIIFLIIQQLEGNLIYPHVVGNSVGLPSIWVLVAVTLGGKLFGVMGMLVFIPLSSVLYTLFRNYINNRLQVKKINISSEVKEETNKNKEKPDKKEDIPIK